MLHSILYYYYLIRLHFQKKRPVDHLVVPGTCYLLLLHIDYRYIGDVDASQCVIVEEERGHNETAYAQPTFPPGNPVPVVLLALLRWLPIGTWYSTGTHFTNIPYTYAVHVVIIFHVSSLCQH